MWLKQKKITGMENRSILHPSQKAERIDTSDVVFFKARPNLCILQDLEWSESAC